MSPAVRPAWGCVALLLALLVLRPDGARAQPAGLPALPPGRLEGVAPDFTLLLEDGRRLRLAGIGLPARPLADPSPQPWPLAQAARERLTSLLREAPLTLLAAAGEDDRWGRRPVHVVTAAGLWVQEDLLRRGLARVMTAPDDRAGADLLLAAEAPAREARLGLWAEPATALRRPDEAVRLVDSRQVVEGVVTSVHSSRAAIYVNLGEDWRRALGLRLTRRLAAALPGDVFALVGRRVRVRGWIGKAIGPIMTLSHPEQLEAVEGWPAAGGEHRGPDGRAGDE